MSGDLALLSATACARAIRSGEATAREATEACLARIADWQPRLNLFIDLRAAEARAAADEADAEAKRGRFAGALHGVPLAHKDMYYRKGRVSTCGSKIRRDFVAPTTARALTRLDAAGALDLGTLNMVEFALGPTGHNWHFGHCRNAWDRTRITGGSSSGSGTGVAARLFYGALGSDTGGSIRLPAAFCGTVGIKPTWGRVSRAGAMPLSHTLDTVGPLTRTVEDAALILGLIAGPDPADPTAAAEPVPDYVGALAGGATGLTIGVPTTFFVEDIDPAVAAALVAARREFEAAGARVIDVAIPDLAAVNMNMAIVAVVESAAIHRRWMIERPQDYSAQVRARIEIGFGVTAVDYADALRARGPALREFTAAAFAACDALLVPATPFAAPPIDDSTYPPGPEMQKQLVRISRLTRPANYLGLPALSIPAGFSADGLPLGLQLMGRPFDEGTLFRLGHAFQARTDWHARVPA